MMKPISSQEMTAIRADVASAALDLPCTIKRATKTRDAYGTETETLSTIATVNCGVSQPNRPSLLANYAYVIGDLATYQVLLPYDTDVRIKDTLVIEDRTLIVQVVLTPESFSAVQGVLASMVQEQ